MDLRQYLKVIARRYKVILLITVLMVGTSIAMTSRQAISYPTTLFYTISLDDNQQTEDFKYSNFYAEQAGLEFARTVSGWFDDPALEAKVFEKAGVNRDDELTLLKKLLGFFSAERIERQNINVSFSSSKDQRSHDLADSLTETLKERLIAYNLGSNSNYKIVLSSKWIEKKEPSYPLSAVLSLFMGLIFGIFAVFIYEYLSGKVSTLDEANEIFGKEAIEYESLKNWPNKYFDKIFKNKSPKYLVGLGFTPVLNDKKITCYNFSTDMESIDFSKEIFFIAILGHSVSTDLSKIVQLSEESKRELIVLE